MDHVREVVAGGAGGAAFIVAGFPFDTLKVRMQSAEKGVYNGFIDAAIKSVRRDGFPALYKGLSAPLIAQPPMFAVYFGSYHLGNEISKKVPGLHRKDGTVDFYAPAIAFSGAFSAIPGTFLLVPAERIKIALQVQVENVAKGAKPKYSSAFDCFMKIKAEEGIKRGLYKGTVATLARDVPGCVGWYGGYYFFKSLARRKDGTYSIPGIINAGGCGGIVNWIICMPADVIKTKIQNSAAGQYPGGIYQVLTETIKKEGISGMYRGFIPAIMRTYPANAACFSVVELVRYLLL